MEISNKLKSYELITDAEVKHSLFGVIEVIKNNLPEYTDMFPSHASKSEIYPKSENDDWTTGFWTGQLWLSYEMTGEECFKNSAEIQVESFLHRIINRIAVNNHDMGFLYSLSCVAAYKLTGNENGKKAAIMAADNLASRYREIGNFLQAWGNIDDPAEYRLIIDCLLNLPLLYWASEVTGDKSYADKAYNHIQTAMKCLVRPDNSTYHTHYLDVKTGEPTEGITRQGNRNDSAWSRGQAWGIYGAALSYKYIKNPEYIELFRRVSDYFMENLPEDLVPYWDFDFTTGSDEPRDSSAAAIAACGMLEMSKSLPKDEAEKYTTYARMLLKALKTHCENTEKIVGAGILKHGVYARSSENNPCRNRGVDEYNTWGDYFYLEALVRLSKDWELYW